VGVPLGVAFGKSHNITIPFPRYYAQPLIGAYSVLNALEKLHGEQQAVVCHHLRGIVILCRDVLYEMDSGSP